MIAYFTVFWWHQVPLAWIYNTGNTHWTPDAPAFEGWKCKAGPDGTQACETLTGGGGGSGGRARGPGARAGGGLELPSCRAP